MTLDEQILREHIASGPFQCGLDLNKWQEVTIDWPHMVISISAAPHEGWPAAYGFRFECNNYPEDAVTAQPWDIERKAPLEHAKWPGGKDQVAQVFNPGWQNGSCLYLPCDRITMQNHAPEWAAKYVRLAWKSTKNIILYLDAVYDLLNSKSYTGPRGS